MTTDGIHPGAGPWIRRWPAQLGLIVLAATIAVFGYGSYRAVERDLTEAALSGRTAISVLAASTLTQDFQRWIDVGRALASRVRFGELLQQGRWSEAARIMANVPRDFPGVEQVLICDAQGMVQAVVPVPDGVSGPLLPAQPVPMSLGQPFISDVQLAAVPESHGYFIVALPVIQTDEPPLAVLALRISTQHFMDLFATLQLERRGSVQVIDRSGQLAFDTLRPENWQVTDLSGDSTIRRMRASEAGVGMDDSMHAGEATGNDVVAFAATPFGWGILARWPRQSVFAARDAQLRRVLFACGLFATMVAVAFGLLLRLAVERRQTNDERRVNLELESAVRERTAQLEKANVDLESFSYSVSHDLRAPLRAIDGYVHFLFEEHQDVLGASARRCVDNVHRNVQHMSRLIDELLELARVGRIALKQEQIDMGALVQDVLLVVLGTRNDVSVQVQALPSVRADATLIRQVWVNLLDNAVKYSSRTPLPHITVCAQTQAGQVIYCVVDNGVGFNMQHYERLFKPFSRLHSPGEFSGTGVGLALVKRIVERHDGRVWAESIPNQSTKIFFSLPTLL
jgi:signal transduction histidine kinase